MKTELFDYHLPSEKIAQHPIEPRDNSRLLVVMNNEAGSSSSGNGVKAERHEVEPGIQVNSYAERANTFQGNDNGPGFRVADVPATNYSTDGSSDQVRGGRMVDNFSALPGMTESSFSEIIFRDITSLLRPDDILVINDTRVMPARIRGITYLESNKREKIKEKREGLKIKDVECLFLRNTAPDIWEIMCFPGERLKTGRTIILENGMTLEIVGETYAGRLVRVPVPHHEWLEVLQKYGEVPLPPYITEHLANSELYQTVYAENLGSTAAPTAGRHFTPELLDKIQNMGVKIARVTLHIGPGTFKPIYEDDVTEYQIHSEFVTIPRETIELLNNRKGRVIAVGTTSMRSLESLAAGLLSPIQDSKFKKQNDGLYDDSGNGNNNLVNSGNSVSIVSSYSGNTDLYITPGYQFQIVDVLITNFHAPRTSLLVLVAAFMGLENMQAAYQYALDHDFRFLSFGDAMWIKRM